MYSGESRWFRFVAPSDKEVAIISRRLSSKNSGAEYRLYYDSTGVTLGTAKPAYNMNRRINTASTSSINPLTAAPTTLGTDIVSLIYIGAGASGVGNASAGTNSKEDGFTIYSPSQYFDTKITNLSSGSNDIKVILEFAEVSNTIVTP